MQIFDLFDVKRKGVIDFGDFVRSLNVFHPNAPQEDKIDCKLRDTITLMRSRVFQHYIDYLHIQIFLHGSFI